MLTPGDRNAESMWALVTELFPIYRTLAGPGFLASLACVARRIPLTISEFPSGMRVFDWVIPREFEVNESYVVDPNGRRLLDFADCHYHVYAYSQPFHGRMSRESLLEHITTHPVRPDVVPLGVTYYREKWGLCASREQVSALAAGEYEVRIDTVLRDGVLRIGEFFLPGETEQEILITSYLCHPRGANDNLSGVAVATELFRLLSELPHRRYSYRLAIWPETIGAITYIYHYPERLVRTAGGFVLLCLGDEFSGRFHYVPSRRPDSIIDRVMLHALKHSGEPYQVLPDGVMYSDERQFNTAGVRLQFGSLMRTPPGEFDVYHTSGDDLRFIKPEALLKSLRVYWKALMALERTRVFVGSYTVEPFLSAYGIYPFDLGGGEATWKGGADAKKRFDAFYQLMGSVDGTTDLIDIADRVGVDIEYFDRPVADFLRTGLMRPVDREPREG